MNKVEYSKEIIKGVAEKTNRAILFYSTGKDSIVTLDLMHEYFDEIICVFMYFVPNLEHINRYLRWAKTRYPKIKIVEIPHWNLTYILRGGVYCVPNPKVRVYKVGRVDEAMRIKYGINYSFYGMKRADGLHRRLMLDTYEGGISNTNKVYPLVNWTNREIMQYMRSQRLPIPVRYSKNASGGVGFNIDVYLWLRNNEPEDLAKMYEAFPFSQKILLDYDTFKARHEKEVGETLTDDEVLPLFKKK